MLSRWAIAFFFHTGLCGLETFATQSGVQKVKGVEGERFTFPVGVLNLQPESDVVWKHGSENTEWSFVRIQGGKIEAVYQDRFQNRLQLDDSGSLQINNLEAEDAGFYQVDVAPGSYKNRFYLSVYNPVPEPQVLQIHSANRSCTLQCFVGNASEVNVSWMRDQVLQIHSGEALANRSCTLQCFVGNASEVNVSWMRDGKPLHTTELEISQEMQGGDVTYSCVASNPASNNSITVTPSHYCDKRKGNEEGETTTIRLSTELIVRVLVFIVLSGVVIAVCVSVWKKINASSECRVDVNRPQLSQQTDDKLTTVYEEVQAKS
ncbi:UNVERIFIED_CONTAM: hypothetical protein FKN15_071940 [Acipenser sinensis]